MEGHMKKSKLTVLLLTLALLLVFSGCRQDQNPEVTTPNMGEVNNSTIGSHKNMQYQYLTNVDEALLATNLDERYLLLANKTNPLGSSYEPSGLVELGCAVLEPSRIYELEARAAGALAVMLAEMQAAGVSDVMVASAYRSYSYQVATYNRYVEFEQSCISADAYRTFGESYIKTNYLEKGIYRLDLADAHVVVQSYSALPGQSEHQTGLCVDLTTSETGAELTEAFENTAAFAWLSENAYKFGFILRYPKGMEGITGYTYEPWHYRFVGREAATDIYLGSLTLEQYLSVYQK